MDAHDFRILQGERRRMGKKLKPTPQQRRDEAKARLSAKDKAASGHRRFCNLGLSNRTPMNLILGESAGWSGGSRSWVETG